MSFMGGVWIYSRVAYCDLTILQSGQTCLDCKISRSRYDHMESRLLIQEYVRLCSNVQLLLFRSMPLSDFSLSSVKGSKYESVRMEQHGNGATDSNQLHSKGLVKFGRARQINQTAKPYHDKFYENCEAWHDETKSPHLNLAQANVKGSFPKCVRFD